MKTLVLAFGLALVAAPAMAHAIQPAEAKGHVGQTVTVEGVVDNVHTAKSGNTYVDIGGRYPNNAFAAVIFSKDASKFPNVSALKGKTVDVSGSVRLYQGKPEIILTDAGQLKAK
jgi:DNA/RNA endonuclease YhcR with UshA esterase domain